MPPAATRLGGGNELPARVRFARAYAAAGGTPDTLERDLAHVEPFDLEGFLSLEDDGEGAIQ